MMFGQHALNIRQLGGLDYAVVNAAVMRLEARVRHDRSLAAQQQTLSKVLKVEIPPQ